MTFSNHNNGVSTLLSFKKLILKNKTNIIQLAVLNNQFNFWNNKHIINSFIFIPVSSIFFKNSLNCNLIQSITKPYYKDNGYLKFNAFIKFQWFLYKFRYFGKGLKIKKSTISETIDFNLGNSHISNIYFNSKKIKIFRTRKNTYTIITNKYIKIINSEFMYQIKPYNIYTRRGLRLNRQNFIKRFGKVSQIASKKR